MSELSPTFIPFSVGPGKLPNTDVAQDQCNEEELKRLAIQDQMLADVASGALPEQEDVERFKRVLDIGCGVGGWAIEAARSYPQMELLGIDINPKMVEYASAQAMVQGVSQRVSFQVMDALVLPGLKNASFDLVNQRIGCSYLRTWDWPRLLREMVRVTRPGGTIRLTEPEIISHSNSEAYQQMCEMLLQALYAAHHLFNPEPTGLVPHLKSFLEEQGCRDVQVQSYTIEYRTGTVAHEIFYQETVQMFRTFRPFILKWGNSKKDYDGIREQMLRDMRQADFKTRVSLSTAWGRTPD